jgi:hypothetical protein
METCSTRGRLLSARAIILVEASIPESLPAPACACRVPCPLCDSTRHVVSGARTGEEPGNQGMIKPGPWMSRFASAMSSRTRIDG